MGNFAYVVKNRPLKSDRKRQQGNKKVRGKLRHACIRKLRMGIKKKDPINIKYYYFGISDFLVSKNLGFPFRI